MKRRGFITLLGGAAAMWPLAARAEEAGKKYTIGIFSVGSQVIAGVGPVQNTAFWIAFFDALRDLGWVEGRNVLIERRYAENQLERLPVLAAELVRLNVDVIVGSGTLAPLAAKRATSTIPIVMTAAGDPLGSGLVANLARPGGNVTGMSLMAPDLGGKRLELLKELLPRLARVAVLWNAANPYSAILFKETQAAGRTLGIEVQSLEVRKPEDLDDAFQAARRQHPDALVSVEDPFTGTYRKRIADFALSEHLPSLHGLSEDVKGGGLMSYGANLADLFRRSAGYVDKILRGAKPDDLPVQQPALFELVINLKTAKAICLDIPPTLLARADEVIE
jgi:putative ABC transport system substrate-binding protein